VSHRFAEGALVTLQMVRGPVAARVVKTRTLDAQPLYDVAVVEGPWAFKPGGRPTGVPDDSTWISARSHRVAGDDAYDAQPPAPPQEA
jgi:hypothetical protein